MGYHPLAISATSKARCIHFCLLGHLSSVSITRSHTWLYSPVACTSTTRKQQSSDISSQAQGALEGVNAASFPAFCLQVKFSSSCPIWAKGYFRDDFPQDTLSAEPLLPPNAHPDPNSRKFPFPSLHYQGSSYAMCIFPHPLALSWQRCRLPRASPQHSCSRVSTDLQHTLFPPLISLYRDSQFWVVFRKLLKPSLH